MLTEIFCQKLIVSNVILVFLDHPKPKVFFKRHPFSKSLNPPLDTSSLHCISSFEGTSYKDL